MKIEYINPFILATKKVLSTMASTESQARKPSLKSENNFKALGDISAVIELSGESKGSIGISFTKSCILNIAEQMFGEKLEDLQEDLVDMVGEIVNMVSGEARRELAKLGFHFSAGIPVTMMGENHEIKHFVEARIILIPFQTTSGEYFIEACFESNKFLK